MTTNTTYRPVALVILDGWGIGKSGPGNAIEAAETPTMDRIWSKCPHTTLLTSGSAVGLPEGQMGNSEVGHLNIGAGFIVHQWISRVDHAIADGELAANPILTSAIDHCIAANRTLHIGGLVSDGGVHSHIRHIFAFIEIAAARGLNRIAIDAFTDGRDTLPTSGIGFIADLEHKLAEMGVGRIATISGRYYAMDRDKRWQRTQSAYDTIVTGQGRKAPSAQQAIHSSYDAGVTDEFIIPTIIPNPDGPDSIQDGDVFLFANFRSDRGRQLTHALSDPDFSGFERSRVVAGTCRVITMTRYEVGLLVDVLFEPHDVVTPLAKVISDAGLAQFHCAETEKYPHVTFFINGGREEPFPGEVRKMIPSPKVATYDLQPEMSAIPVADATIAAIESGKYAFIVVNFANPDMVGHTGNIPAVIKAVETVDGQLARVLAALQKVGGVALVIADHGNAEEEIDEATGGPMTAHTTNPVPFVLVGDGKMRLRDGAVLSSVAPTILQLLGLPVPADMTTPSLFEADWRSETYVGDRS
jgi:2,3-bisphosphoglycerate-independent phosphoglycerate mutase